MKKPLAEKLLTLLTKIREEKDLSGMQPEPPSDPENLRDFEARLVEEKLGPLPEEWSALLRQSNGLTWNGVSLFGIDEENEEGAPFSHGGLIEFNRRPRPLDKPATRFFLLGHTDMDYLAYDQQEHRYLSLDLSDWGCSTVYADFDAFFEEQAEIMLGEAPLA